MFVGFWGPGLGLFRLQRLGPPWRLGKNGALRSFAGSLMETITSFMGFLRVGGFKGFPTLPRLTSPSLQHPMIPVCGGGA